MARRVVKPVDYVNAAKPTRTELTALSWAVNKAAEWRGSLTGDPVGLSGFDTQVMLARAALTKVRRMCK